MLHILSFISLVAQIRISDAAGLTGSAYATWFYQQYNAQNFQTIYNLFSQQSKLMIPYANFSADLQNTYNNEGTVIYNMEVQSPDPSGYSQNVVFSKSISAGIFQALMEDGSVSFATMNAMPNTSIVDMVKNFRNKMSFIFIQDGKTLVNINPTKQLGLGSTIVIPILIEYANQIAAKRLRAAQAIKKSDIARYYLGPIDYAYLNITFSASGTISLGGLMLSLYVNPSLAALEYVIDLLTPAKVQATAQSLGIRATILYPVSLRVVLGNPQNLTQADYISAVTKISASSLQSLVRLTHDNLKKGGSTAQRLLMQTMTGLMNDFVASYIASNDQLGQLSQYVTAMSNIAQSKFTIKGGQTAAKIVPTYQTFQSAYFKGAGIPQQFQKMVKFDSIRGYVNILSQTNCNGVMLVTVIFNSGQTNKYFTMGIAINGFTQYDALIFSQLSSLVIPLNFALSPVVRQQLTKVSFN